MPVYNGERFVGEAIQSILDQSFRDFELIICDNASTDRTEEICTAFAAQDSRVRYFRNPVNLGAHPNFNRAFALARGRYFKWAPHDDRLHPDYLRACVAALDADPGAAVCQADLEYIDEAGQSIGVVRWDLTGAGAPDPWTRFAELTLRSHNCYDVMGLFRRDVLGRSMLLPSFHGADRALLAQLATFGTFAHVHEPLLRIRDHAGRYTRAKVRPSERAKWHDSRKKGRLSFPTWRVYGTYWRIVWGMPAPVGGKLESAWTLVEWWFVNWNAARMAVDVIATVAPGFVGFAERVKQQLFSPAPGIDEVRRSHHP